MIIPVQEAASIRRARHSQQERKHRDRLEQIEIKYKRPLELIDRMIRRQAGQGFHYETFQDVHLDLGPSYAIHEVGKLITTPALISILKKEQSDPSTRRQLREELASRLYTIYTDIALYLQHYGYTAEAIYSEGDLYDSYYLKVTW